GLATLRQLDGSTYTALGEITTRLASGLRTAAGDRPVQVRSVPGLLTVFFSAARVDDFSGAQACDTRAYGRFCRGLLERGVSPPASQFEAWFPSLAHDDESIEATIDVAGEAFEQAAD